MNTRHLGFLFVMVLSAVTLRSQTTEGMPSGPTPAPQPPAPYYPPGYPYSSSYTPTSPPSTTPGYSQYTFYNNTPSVVGTISLPYAFNWNAVGITGELGGLWMGQHFFGAEVSYYGGDSERYDVYAAGTYQGHFYSNQDITTVDFAYRYFAPLAGYGRNPLAAFYVGGSAGVGFVNYSNSGSYFGFHTDDTGVFSGDLVAGFQFNAYPGVGARIGYKYIYVNQAWQYDRRVNLDSSALEASLTFRF
jgi:hypothetical protein